MSIVNRKRHDEVTHTTHELELEHDNDAAIPPQNDMRAAIAAAQLMMTSSRRIAGVGNLTGDILADPATFSVNRVALLDSIARFQARDKYCWTLPLGLAGFILWCIAVALHSNVGTTNSIELGCVV